MNDAATLFARANPPGERQLHYRVGTYQTFLRQMLAELPRHQVCGDGIALRPLEVLDPSSSRDFAAALLDAWAMVGDVLTFYQERMLNEGYLHTAVQALSVRDLTAELGFPLQPGIASSTWLAFAVSGAPGAPDKIEIGAGAAAQSIPGTGEQPQTFETSAALTARPAWNTMVPAPNYVTQAQTLAVTDTQARLSGTGTGLALGAPLLAAAADGSAWSFGTVTSVEAKAQSRETRVAWSPALAGTHGSGAMAAPAVWAFGRSTRLFGYNAADWGSLTTEQKRAYRQILGGVFVLADGTDDWTAASDGLPAVDVRAVAVDEAGRIYAGTAGAGLYVSADGGATWSAGGPRWGDVYSLSVGAPGRVYAGMAGGRIYRSCDGGQSWDSVSGNTTLSTTQAGSPPQVLPTRLPAAPIRAVFDDGAGTVYAGTDFGPYAAAEAMPGWSALPLYPDAPAAAASASPPAAVSPAVWSFALAPWGNLAVGTDQGVFSADGGLPLGAGFPVLTPAGTPNVVRALLADGPALLAGCDAGLYELVWSEPPGVHPVAEWGLVPGPAQGGAPLPVTALAYTADGVVAATPAGVYRRDGLGEWVLLGTQGTPASPPCASPPCSPPGDCGQPLPIPAPPGLNQANVVALAAGPGGLVAAAPYAGFPVEAWPAPPICDDIVYLSGIIPQVVPGSWIVLQQAPDPAGGGPPAAVAVLRVVTARTSSLERYGRRGQATEVKVEPAPGLEVFDLRATNAFAASRALSLVSDRLPELLPFAGSTLKLAGALPSLPAGRSLAVSGRRIRAALWPRAGVFVPARPEAKTPFAPAGLASVDVVAVAWGPGGVVLAAVGGEPGDAGPAAGLYGSADGGATWTPAAGALAGARVHALASGGGAVWAAGPRGTVFTSVDGKTWSAAGTVGGAVTALAVDGSGAPLAATADAGVLRRGGDGRWSALGAGLPTRAVRGLAVAPNGGVGVAMADGAWWLAPGATEWVAWSQGLTNVNVRALAFLPSGEALAGTAGGGVFCAPAGGEAWEPASSGLDADGARAVIALAAGPDGRAWAGTRGAGCYLRAAGTPAAPWTPAPLGAANDVRALAAGGAGPLAGCGAIPLLVTDGLPRPAFGLESLLSVDSSHAADLDRGSLPTALQKTLNDAGITATEKDVVRVQTAGQAWWIDAAQGVLLLRLDAGAIRVRRPRALLTLMGPPATSSDGMAVADNVGHAGTLTPRSGELVWQPASNGSAAVSEKVEVAGSAATGLRRTLVTLAAPLANAYDPSTVKLNGNLAPATNGATQGAWPRPEVLGNGNASAAGQSFALARAPLTYIAADTPSGRAAALMVWVNGVQWAEVETLYGAGPADNVYQVRVDETGAATIQFGDGVNGARLPTGVGNVTAQYRVGIGPAGNLAAGRITILRSAPLGVRSVSNPLPAEGGASGQSTAEAAVEAPLEARVLERVVALRDFRDYALTYPGISKARAESVRDARGRAVVAVTVAGGRGASELPDQGLLDELHDAMLSAGARGRFQVLAYEPLELVVHARVEVDPHYQVKSVAAAATAALTAEYSPGTRALGEGAAASRAVQVLQAVPGVLGVELLAFHLAGTTPAVETWIPAQAAWVDARGKVRGAQLLLPAATGGVVVRAEAAS